MGILYLIFAFLIPIILWAVINILFMQADNRMIKKLVIKHGKMTKINFISKFWDTEYSCSTRKDTVEDSELLLKRAAGGFSVTNSDGKVIFYENVSELAITFADGYTEELKMVHSD